MAHFDDSNGQYAVAGGEKPDHENAGTSAVPVDHHSALEERSSRDDLVKKAFGPENAHLIESQPRIELSRHIAGILTSAAAKAKKVTPLTPDVVPLEDTGYDRSSMVFLLSRDELLEAALLIAHDMAWGKYDPGKDYFMYTLRDETGLARKYLGKITRILSGQPSLGRNRSIRSILSRALGIYTGEHPETATKVAQAYDRIKTESRFKNPQHHELAWMEGFSRAIKGLALDANDPHHHS